METTASIKVESTIKIEAEEPAQSRPLQIPVLKSEPESTQKKEHLDPVDLPNSQKKVENPASQPKEDASKEVLEQQKNLIYKACFDFIRSNMMPAVPKPMDMFPNFLGMSPFGSLLPDPYTLKAFVNFKKEYETFASRMNLPAYLPPISQSNPPRSNLPTMPQTPSSNNSQKSNATPKKANAPVPIITPSKPVLQEKESGQPPILSIIKAENNIIEKKEENAEQTSLLPLPVAVENKSPEEDSPGSHANASGDEENSPQSEKKVPKKKAQNRIKNIPGLIVQRVRSSIKNYLSLNPKLDKHERRLGYVDKVLVNVNKNDRDRLLAFLEGYQKNWKTWNTIQNFLKTNTKYGAILLDVVLQFFGPDGNDDFNEWLTSGKMGQKSKIAVTEMKDKIGAKFSKILLKAETQETNQKDKMIKTEEGV